MSLTYFCINISPMKKIISLSLIYFLLVISATAQEDRPMFTFCQQSTEFETTWKEFSKCKTEITPIDKEAKIVSFTISILAVDGGDTIWVDRTNLGNTFDDETKMTINQLYNSGKMANQILIDDVIISENKKEFKAQSLKINLK